MTAAADLSVANAAAAIRAGRLSAVDLVEACLDRIDAREERIQAWVAVDNGPWTGLGVPSVSVPSGLDPDGLPLGTQLIGAPFGGERLVAAARWVETAIGFTAAPVL